MIVHKYYQLSLRSSNFRHGLNQWSQRNALFEPISEATPTVLPTTVRRATERASDAMPQERPHIRNMTESLFRQTIIKTLNCLYY